jgi:preprotein translocase subunit SecD
MANVRSVFLSQLGAWLLVAAVAVYFLYPLRNSIRLGMDLAGGTYLTLEVQTEKAIEEELVERLQNIEKKLKSDHKPTPQSKKIVGNSIELTYDTPQTAQDVALALRDELKDLTSAQSGNVVTLTLPEKIARQIEDDAVTRNITILRTRLDPYGASEIPIARQGKKRIIVELSDTENTLEAKSRIGKSAKLDFRLVDKIGSTPEDILYEFDSELPSDKVILMGKTKQPGQTPTYYLVQKYADITGKFLKTAQPSLGGESGMEPAVSFQLNAEGANRFYELTSKNIGRTVAIVLDDVVISAGQIKSAIRDTGQISGSFKNSMETKELAQLLQSGAYVAPVTFEEERQIGPSLGQESINKGLLSCLIGFALIFVFSIYYYSLSGFFAFLALMFNVLLILLGLSWLRATLTLPGIAGIVLTVGMAIDASILIYEQIKESLKKGDSVRQAVNHGFSDAMVVILDGNITTFIIGVVLYYTGTGPIQGFAVTMMIGIIATLITGLFFLRSLFKFMLDNFSIQKLKI